MNCLDTHFRLNRFLLLAIGLWPLKRSKFAQVQFIILFSILITFIIFQFTSLLTSRCTVDLIVNILSSTFFFICLAIKYNSFWINADTMRLSLEKLQHTCNELKNEDEIAIIEKYSRIGKIQTIAITMFGAMSLCSFLLLTLGPYAFNIVFSVNNSQSRIVMVLKTEYFIDQEKYFYLIVLHGNAALFIGATAMKKKKCIYSYRIKEAMTINVQQDIDHEKMIICYRGIVCAVDIHRKAIEFSQVFIKSFQGSFFFLIAAGMICLSNNLVQIALYVNTLKQFILSLTFVMVLYVYMFLSNYTAQEITDHNEYVFATV
ncbi:hypothetical protein PUN28_014512 [Cardiocondyla obscurior]